MKKIIHWFAPKDKEISSLLAEQSSHGMEAIKELKNFIGIYQDIERTERKLKVESIKNIERKADGIKYIIIERLGKGLKASADKEDIRRLSVILEDVVDLTNSSASKLVILGIERIDVYIPKFIDLDVEMILELNKLILNLNKLKEVEDSYSKISELENKIDDIYREALSELYHFYKNSIDIMKYREIYEFLEQIADKCKDAANIAKSISAKRS